MAANRSLERGLRILRTFRPGTTLKGNAEIAELIGLPRSTVSRLTQSLVACGFLEHDLTANAYRLAAPVLSLAEAYRADSEVLRAAVPMMTRISERLRVNIAIAVPDFGEMVYMHTIRRYNVGVPRSLSAGRRTPIELTSLGHTYLATCTEAERTKFIAGLRETHPDRWSELVRGFQQSARRMAQKGYCSVPWLPGVTTIATCIRVDGRARYFTVISVASSEFSQSRVEGELAPALLEFAQTLGDSLSQPQGAAPAPAASPARKSRRS